MLNGEKITLKFLGSGDAFCSGGRFQTCFQVQIPDFNFFIDCGGTSLLAMKKNGVSSADVDAILLSHFHGDHYGGLPSFLIDAQYVSGRTKPLEIMGPSGTRQRVLGLMENMYPGTNLEKYNYEVILREYSQGADVELGPLQLSAFEVIHAPDSIPHGFRIQVQDKTIAFSGDTGWVDTIYDIETNADLFICECNFFETEVSLHINYQTLVKKLGRFTSKQLILNHLGDEMLEKLDQVEPACANDGDIIIL